MKKIVLLVLLMYNIAHMNRWWWYPWQFRFDVSIPDLNKEDVPHQHSLFVYDCLAACLLHCYSSEPVSDTDTVIETEIEREIVTFEQ